MGYYTTSNAHPFSNLLGGIRSVQRPATALALGDLYPVIGYTVQAWYARRQLKRQLGQPRERRVSTRGAGLGAPTLPMEGRVGRILSPGSIFAFGYPPARCSWQPQSGCYVSSGLAGNPIQPYEGHPCKGDLCGSGCGCAAIFHKQIAWLVRLSILIGHRSQHSAAFFGKACVSARSTHLGKLASFTSRISGLQVRSIQNGVSLFYPSVSSKLRRSDPMAPSDHHQRSLLQHLLEDRLDR